jgi:hypothetical protein
VHQFAQVRICHHPARGDHHHPVRDLLKLAHMVRGDQHRATRRRVRAQQILQPADTLRVHAVRRLVQDQHVRITEQRRRDAEPLAHAQ